MPEALQNGEDYVVNFDGDVLEIFYLVQSFSIYRFYLLPKTFDY